MRYTSTYHSPLGEILLAADETALTGLWFAGQKRFARGLAAAHSARETIAIAQAKRWLDVYFSGCQPDFMPQLRFSGTPFQHAVWEILTQIPYGQTMTYGEIAQRMAGLQGREHMSAQAVGGAVGRNPLSIIVPCHRVIGTDGSLTGYAGGIERKIALLTLEGVDRTRLVVPRNGTAL